MEPVEKLETILFGANLLRPCGDIPMCQELVAVVTSMACATKVEDGEDEAEGEDS